MSQDNMESILEKQFTIDIIEQYLTNIKNALVKMNILLDTHEINKCLADSLNRVLLQNIIDIETIYSNMLSNWDLVSNSIPIIEEKIRKFNINNNYKYYVNKQEVFYLVFYNQIKYIKKILQELNFYLNSKINLIFIYTWLIQSIYDKPEITLKYIFILGKEIKQEQYLNSETMSDFLSEEKIKILGKMLEIIYLSDTKFIDLNEQLSNEKISFISTDIKIPVNQEKNNPNCLKKDIVGKKILDIDKKLDPSTRRFSQGIIDIEELEKKFNKLKCELLFEKRPIDLSTIYKNINFILENVITKELWMGFLLFLYKKFTFNFDEFKKNIESVLISLSYSEDYFPNIDTFKDLAVGDSVYLSKQLGGNHNYFAKYLKYKTKYFEMKIKNTKQNILK